MILHFFDIDFMTYFLLWIKIASREILDLKGGTYETKKKPYEDFFIVFVLSSNNLLAIGDINEARRHLKKAHEAFLNKRYKKVALRLRDVFKNSEGNEAIERNALDLLEATHAERGKKRIPVNWELPSEIHYMKVGFRRQYNQMTDNLAYKIDVAGLMAKPDELEQFEIIKYPDRIIVNKEKGIGYFGRWENSEKEAGFYIGRKFESINFDGLYSLKIRLKGKKEVKGWFISSSMKSSEVPIVKAPSEGQGFYGPNPKIKWENFISPEYQQFEERRFYLKVNELKGRKETVWKFAETNSSRESIIVGERGEGVESLEKGPYTLHLQFGERRKFGPLRLSRDSRIMVSFEVK